MPPKHNQNLELRRPDGKSELERNLQDALDTEKKQNEAFRIEVCQKITTIYFST